MSQILPKRALLSVSDKRGLVDLAQALVSHGVEVLSTGGSARALAEHGITVKEVSDVTGFPEIMGGRVKTLHPTIHGGILARRGVDEAVMAEHGIGAIDLVVVNLYPFNETIARVDVTIDEAIENIDIGGPAMLRAAAKNHAHVTLVVDPDDYSMLIDSLQQGGPDAAMRRRLAVKGFQHTAAYDASVSSYLDDPERAEPLPSRLRLDSVRRATLRYGENPHQAAAWYTDTPLPLGSLAAAEQVQGKALSYNNLNDSDAALAAVREFSAPACVIVKHANPCGVACGADLAEAYEAAWRCDPVSAFGGILAFNRELDEALARTIVERQFVEVILAPNASEAAREVIATKGNIRLLLLGDHAVDDSVPQIKRISGGWLAQQPDHGRVTRDQLTVVSQRQPDEQQLQALEFAWRVACHVKSNAIVFAAGQRTLGVGAGQMSRIDSTRIAGSKAAEQELSLRGAVMASDAFFPFRDGIDAASEYGISAIIQPGGSMRDDEVIAAADEHDLAMVFTGMRHFRH
ncbi:bifunctional phosphoribosylaminoimidazolecarboxamide formyltransferase/IMP cyclohydrolase [Gammaproteobacteria bacterium]|nr:bifunctional phosphoribosylaminoimidazolecarboxamide formyltransferase/IMP cyclohydrolase [Gammaproteobacteria bacterium]